MHSPPSPEPAAPFLLAGLLISLASACPYHRNFRIGDFGPFFLDQIRDGQCRALMQDGEIRGAVLWAWFDRKSEIAHIEGRPRPPGSHRSGDRLWITSLLGRLDARAVLGQLARTRGVGTVWAVRRNADMSPRKILSITTGKDGLRISSHRPGDFIDTHGICRHE